MMAVIKYVLIAGVFLLGSVSAASAGGAVTQRQRMAGQMKAQQQAMMQKQIREHLAQQMAMQARGEIQQKAQAVAQQQAIAVARQQASVVAQRQAQQIANQAAVVARYQAQQAAAQAAGQGTVAAQYAAQMATGQAIAAQRQVEQVTMDMVLDAGLRQKMAEEAAGIITDPANEPEVAEIVTLDDVMQSLSTSSEAWSLMIDTEAKEAVVQQYIEQYRQQGVTISKPAAYYVQSIDAMSQQSPEMLNVPFSRILEMISILAYDFDNGNNKDAMALKILGNEQAVAANKKRVGME